MKLFRLAWFNIRRHKIGAISLMILILFCQLLLGVALHNINDIGELYEEKSTAFHTIKNFFCIDDATYREEYPEILREDERVERVVVQDCVLLWSSSIILKNGEEYSTQSILINAEMENQLEQVRWDMAYSEEELELIQHPIIVPYIIKEYYGFEAGDTYKLIYHQMPYEFKIVGFYETTMLASSNMGGIKYFISAGDYEKICGSFGGTKIIGYDLKNQNEQSNVMAHFVQKAKEMVDSGESFNIPLQGDYLSIASIATMLPMLLAYLLILFAFIIFITIFIMIRHRISSDIEEQLVSIGTLEALGYVSKQITLVYIIEYSVLAAVGSLVGIVGAYFAVPIVDHLGETMIGLHGIAKTNIMIDVCMFLAILVLIILISFSKAYAVKKYPPIKAFRKGIHDHHFSKNFFALEKTKGSVHIRLAAKRLVGNLRQNMIIVLCICVASIAMMFSVLLYDCCGKDLNGLKNLFGLEMCDVTIDITRTVSPEQIKQTVSLENKDIIYIVFQNYDDVESIKAYEGRAPQYENEVMITGVLANLYGKEVGDTIQLFYGTASKQYIITGLTQSTMNGGQTIYFNEEGIRQINPSYQSDELAIYLNEGEDRKAFIETIKEKYGASMEDAKKKDLEHMTSSERLRAKAEQEIAAMMSLYGVDHIDYAIMIGDELVTGNSDVFAIENITDVKEFILTNIGAYVKGINLGTRVILFVSTIVIMVILLMLIQASISRQKVELGIYKGIGYTTKQLMLQIALSLMPPVVLGASIGTIIAIVITPSILGIAFSLIGVTHMMVQVNILEAMLLIGFISVFSFCIAMLSAYRIKAISVYDLLTE